MSPGERLQLTGRARALFSARAHSNMSSVSGDHANEGDRARERLREQTSAYVLARGYQVHGTHVQRIHTLEQVQDGGRVDEPADGQATNLASVATMVLTADCLPVALASTNAVAMVHAGWRGLAAGVLERGVEAVRELSEGDMNDDTGGVSDTSGAEEIIAIVGPGAGVCCYEVGPEVHEAFGALGRAHSRANHIDLRAIAHERLLAAGVAEVRDVNTCTICDERFFSHRREGERAGRQAGLAWLS